MFVAANQCPPTCSKHVLVHLLQCLLHLAQNGGLNAVLQEASTKIKLLGPGEWVTIVAVELGYGNSKKNRKRKPHWNGSKRYVLSIWGECYFNLFHIPILITYSSPISWDSSPKLRIWAPLPKRGKGKTCNPKKLVRSHQNMIPCTSGHHLAYLMAIIGWI